MSRVRPIDLEAMSPVQRELTQSIAAKRRTGAPGGPSSVWVHLPEIAGRIEGLLDRLRFESKLDPRVYELITLCVASFWKADFIWNAHAKRAAEAGVSDAVIAAVKAGASPPFERADERAVYGLVTHLQAEHSVGDAAFDAAEEALGYDAVIEVVVAAGYYTMNAMTLRAFEV